MPEQVVLGGGGGAMKMDHVAALLSTYKLLRNAVKQTPISAFSFSSPEKFQIQHMHWTVEVG